MKRKFYYILSFLSIIFLIPSFSFSKSQPTYIHNNLELKYIPYLVKKGDTLYSISKKYNISLDELRELNNLSDNHISEGQILKIPVKLQINKPELANHSNEFSYQNKPQVFYHKVKRGETLYRISKNYGVPLKELMKINGLKTTKLKPGQKIKIYQYSKTEIAQEKPLGKSEKSNFTLYKVKEGDTLYSISLRFNVPLDELKSFNRIEDNTIFVGQKLKIPNSSLDEKPFILENPTVYFKEKPKEVLSQKFSINFLSKSDLNERDENLLKKKFLEIAEEYKNYKYKLGGNGDGYLDCSMFVKLVYEELGIELPRTSREQFLVGIDVGKDELIPGDLLFFSRSGDKERINHVGIYIGNNKFIHFSSSKRGLSIDSLDEPYFSSKFVGAKRILNGEFLEQFYRLSKLENQNS